MAQSVVIEEAAEAGRLHGPLENARSDAMTVTQRRVRLGPLAWLLVPLLSMLAFAPVLGMWFLGDDFGHLLFHFSLPFPQPFLAFGNGSMFYRPLSTALTWNLGYALFGLNALPYHIISLLFHALAAFFLGRAVAVIAGEERVGWLAGVFFGIFPLCTEPVAWLASQWDVFGAACLTGTVWGFAVAWRSGSKRAYGAALVAAFLAVAMKESTLPLPLVMPFVALACELTPRVTTRAMSDMSLRQWSALARMAVLWSLPFFVPTILFVALRYFGAGSIGGYPNVPTDVQHFFWDSLVTAALEMLMPLNRLLFPRTFIQTVGFLFCGLFLVGLVMWGRRRWPLLVLALARAGACSCWRLLVLALAWWLVFLVPVLNLSMPSANPAHGNNRVFYLSTIGFCIALAEIMAGAMQELRRQYAGWVVAGLVIAGTLPITWIQLQPWVDASRQTHHIVDEMATTIPRLPNNWIEINVKNKPDEYKGAFVFLNGLDMAMIGFDNQLTRVNLVKSLNPATLALPFTDGRGRYNLRFEFNPENKLFYIAELSGVTAAAPPPTSTIQLWDFRHCADSMPTGWQTDNAAYECKGSYVEVKPTSNDPHIILPNLNVDLAAKSWVRLGVSVRYPTLKVDKLGEWFWTTDTEPQLSQQRSKSYYLSTSTEWRTYWTYLPAAELGHTLNSLRFDPVNDNMDLQLAWMSVDAIAR